MADKTYDIKARRNRSEVVPAYELSRRYPEIDLEPLEQTAERYGYAYSRIVYADGEIVELLVIPERYGA